MAAYSLFLAVTLFGSLLIASQSAECEGIYSDPRHPGKCTINEGLVLNPGVSIKDTTHECRKIVCGLNGRVVFHSCGVTVASPPCHYSGHLSPELPYPDCCRRILVCN
ncbi:uncharacterized protein LOC108101322 isoform X2 [Drosophila ficusphila]|uniref:uncharacterized protein LOC108101322 isoform X2 n=1 Tax=Drosophila ficusphila TaxID=30025 RepID=UPI0007E5E2D4|nr:uncharacterized protein LOC108101322 isoform X2 [Drosophila ficusphila]XP_017061120.1 uncharacterized protein LOC108101322 isoform X2 [Drosophila ficusphila]